LCCFCITQELAFKYGPTFREIGSDIINDPLLEILGVRRICNVVDYLLEKNRDKGISTEYRMLIKPWSTALQELYWEKNMGSPIQQYNIMQNNRAENTANVSVDTPSLSNTSAPTEENDYL